MIAAWVRPHSFVVVSIYMLILSLLRYGRGLEPEMLATLIGGISHIGTFYGDDEEEYTVQDETGRQVTVLATALREHPIYERLDKRGKESLDHYLKEDKPRKDAIRKAAAERDAGAAP